MVKKINREIEGGSQELLQLSLIDKSLVGVENILIKLLYNPARLPLAIKQAEVVRYE